MSDLFLDHLDTIEKALTDMEAPDSFAFGASCIERQWPVYDRSDYGKIACRVNFLRGVLDDIWEWLTDRRQLPDEYLEKCQKMIPEDTKNDIESAASYIPMSIHSLLHGIMNRDSSEVFHIASCNLNVINEFAYNHMGISISEENDILVNNHILIRREIEHQLDDINLLIRHPSSFDKSVETLRNKSYGKSVFGNLWFDWVE